MCFLVFLSFSLVFLCVFCFSVMFLGVPLCFVFLSLSLMFLYGRPGETTISKTVLAFCCVFVVLIFPWLFRAFTLYCVDDKRERQRGVEGEGRIE